MERKTRTSSLKSSQRMVSSIQTRIKSAKVEEETYSYLPNECWEIVFTFLMNDSCCLNSLSLVSKQFLSITNCFLFSLTVVKNPTLHLLGRLFRRFTNINSLDISDYICDPNKILCKISCFPLKKLTSLIISNHRTFPVDGLHAFSQTTTTVTSLTCSNIFHIYDSDLLLIADCFPLLKELNLGQPLVSNKTNNFITGIHFLKDQHVARMSFFMGNLVSINLISCSRLTESALFSLVRNCPSISEINMECTAIGKKSVDNSGVYPQLKSLYLGKNEWLSDEDIIMFASNFPNLQLLDLNSCNLLSEGISQVLRICCKIWHLNLSRCSKMKLVGMNFVVPKLEVLNLSFTKVDDETLYVISKNCCGLLKLLLNNCDNITEKGVKHVVENCTRLKEIYLGDFHLSDKNRELLSRRGCLLC